jgi:protein-S-isoprenylcysteine O-methyltransferase Ste14
MSLGTFYQSFFSAIWSVWLITWLLFALNVKTTVHRQAPLPRLLNMALLLWAGALLWAPRVPGSGLTERFLPGSLWQFWAALGAVMTLVGLLFTVWARVYLGRNWSGVATIKADHELVTGGPYALVRHPIYSGLLLAFIGSALAVGELRGVLAVALALVAIVHRIGVEERLMRQQFGAAYDAYAGRVPALVPGLIQFRSPHNDN